MNQSINQWKVNRELNQKQWPLPCVIHLVALLSFSEPLSSFLPPSAVFLESSLCCLSEQT